MCIDNNLDTYAKATTKHERSMVVTVIVDAVRECRTSERGGFVRKDVPTGRWYEVGDKTAREKVGHALRDAIKLRKRESKKKTEPSSLSPTSTKKCNKRRRTNNDGDTEFSSPSGSRDVSTTPVGGGIRPRCGQQVDAVPSAVVQAEWEKSLQESAEQFQQSDDEESEAGDSVLTRMALETTVDEPTAPALVASQPNQEPPIPPHQLMVGALPKSSSAPAPTWNPPGFSAPEDIFAKYMKRFGLPAAASSISCGDLPPKAEWNLPTISGGVAGSGRLGQTAPLCVFNGQEGGLQTSRPNVITDDVM